MFIVLSQGENMHKDVKTSACFPFGILPFRLAQPLSNHQQPGMNRAITRRLSAQVVAHSCSSCLIYKRWRYALLAKASWTNRVLLVAVFLQRDIEQDGADDERKQ